MHIDKIANEVFEQFVNEIPGFIAASLVDLDSGMALAARSTRPDLDLTVVSAYNSEFVKQKIRIMKALDLDMPIEDMILTFGDHIHFIRVLSPTLFIDLAVDRNMANIVIVRRSMNRHSQRAAQ